MVTTAGKSKGSERSPWFKLMIGGAVVAGVVSAMAIFRYYQQKQAEPDYQAERAYRQGLRQVQAVEARIPRWLAERH